MQLRNNSYRYIGIFSVSGIVKKQSCLFVHITITLVPWFCLFNHSKCLQIITKSSVSDFYHYHYHHHQHTTTTYTTTTTTTFNFCLIGQFFQTFRASKSELLWSIIGAGLFTDRCSSCHQTDSVKEQSTDLQTCAWHTKQTL